MLLVVLVFLTDRTRSGQTPENRRVCSRRDMSFRDRTGLKELNGDVERPSSAALQEDCTTVSTDAGARAMVSTRAIRIISSFWLLMAVVSVPDTVFRRTPVRRGFSGEGCQGYLRRSTTGSRRKRSLSLVFPTRTSLDPKLYEELVRPHISWKRHSGRLIKQILKINRLR
ncbi:conjugal transfer protein TraP [Klebsiella pneumoniae]|nr:conjugal transfer protein TraP [Klebsiella pneumoniae]